MRKLVHHITLRRHNRLRERVREYKADSERETGIGRVFRGVWSNAI